MIAEFGNFFIVVPYLLILALGVVFIMVALKDRKPPSLPNLTARRKHPLRHLQVELNRSRNAARARHEGTKDEKKEEKKEEKPRRRRPPRNGGGGLRRIR